MFPLLDLPTEIIVRILCPLNVKDAFSVQLTCRQLRNIYTSTVDLLYMLRLEIHGMEDNPSSTWSMGIRSQMLLEREHEWSNCQHLYRLVDPPPRWAAGLPTVTDQYIVYATSQGMDMPLTGIQSYRVPIEVIGKIEDDNDTHTEIEVENGVEVKEPKWSFIGVEDMIDFVCCIEEHDLIAVASYPSPVSEPIKICVQFIQHSTGKPHPLAATSDINVAIQPVPGMDPSEYNIAMNLELCGDNFIMNVEAFPPAICHLYVYNWKTGIPQTNPIPIHNTGLAFLRCDLFLVPDIQDHCLDIYHINSSPTSPSVKRICRFGLPPLQSDGEIISVICHASPNPTGDGNFPKYAPKRRPFRDDPIDAVVFFEWEIAFGEDFGPFVLAVHRKSIIDKLPLESTWSSLPQNNETQTQTQIPTIPWKEWGLDICRWFLTSYATGNHTHGQRFVQWVVNIPEAPGKSFTQCLSFNPYHVKKAISETRKRETKINNNSGNDDDEDEDMERWDRYYERTPSSEHIKDFGDLSRLLREEDVGKLEATCFLLSTDFSVGTAINGLPLMPGSITPSVWCYREY